MSRVNKNFFEKGDLVQWACYDGAPVCGIVLNVWDSNVYEPEECEVFVDTGSTYVIRSRSLKLLSKKQDH